jgi:uncharacterized protein (DUF934 family)
MATLIRHGRIVHETWQRLEREATGAPLESLAVESGAAGILIPLGLWLQALGSGATLPVAAGVVLRGDDDPQPLVPDLDRLAVIAIEFARFSDGRGYSLARLLRSRYGYRGEIRAIGDVLRDQLYYLRRVGFDAFELRADQDAAGALAALADFSESYQAAADQPVPLFRRRAAA